MPAIWNAFVYLFVSSAGVVCVLPSGPIKRLKCHEILFAFVFLSVICAPALPCG